MPTFTAIALERFLEPGDSRSASDSKVDRGNSTPVRANGAAGNDSRPVSVPNRKPSIPLPPTANHNALNRNSLSSSRTTAEKEKPPRPQISPALYATPEATPLPDSPTLHSPSPYLINHKRRGPRLQKSFSETNVLKKKVLDEKMPSSSNFSAKVETKSSVPEQDIVLAAQSSSAEETTTNGLHQEIEKGVMFDLNGESAVLPGTNSVEKESESEDFFDPQDSLSVASNADGEDFGVELPSRTITAGGVFYDAWDELSSEGGRRMLSSVHDLETELREMKLSLLMEIEKRKQAEDALNCLRSQWRRLREELREVGLVLPLDLPTTQDGSNVDFIEEIRQQMYVSRVVSESIGMGAARAECEEAIGAQLESKNFEIARLSDRLRYYETMNREMSQRNQEAIELARRDRRRRSGMQKWAWGSIAAAVTLGSVALAWSYLPSGNPSSSHQLHASKPNTTSTE